MLPPARISIVTLGARDLAGLTAFYEGLGWRKSGASTDAVSFFHTGGAVLGLFGRAPLAEDAGVAPEGEGFRGVALAINVPERGDVDAALAAARKAGAQVVREAHDAFWGGRSGYFADPEGNLWEVAWNPYFPLEDDGRVLLPP